MCLLNNGCGNEVGLGEVFILGFFMRYFEG